MEIATYTFFPLPESSTVGSRCVLTSVIERFAAEEMSFNACGLQFRPAAWLSR